MLKSRQLTVLKKNYYKKKHIQQIVIQISMYTIVTYSYIQINWIIYIMCTYSPNKWYIND